ncbi:MAG: ABC transporter permease [Candidatus Eremiobacteraeota bacterium]|nr:ABC transporter permease [Candidatus Eremiobacteraeota bacterium]
MTRFTAYLEEALASLWRNRVRSILTMLGMIIGSASIIAVFGISKAATSGIAATFTSFGTQPVIVQVDQSQDYPLLAQIQYRDAATVSEALGGAAEQVLPQWNRTMQVTTNLKTDYISTQADGGSHHDALLMAQGRKIDSDDVANAAHVCVVTLDIAREFFTDGAVGKYLRINGGRYEVIGVYADIKGSFLSSIASSTVALPYTTYHEYLESGPVDYLAIFPSEPLAGDALGKAASSALQRIHGPRARYQVQNAAEQLQTFENVLNIIGIGLSAIGGVALVVAGIGIMNIMLVSVAERTREIGIRKSIGANRNDIALQFLMEAVLLSLFGGLIGMIFGLLTTVGAASLLSKQLGELLIPYLLIISIALIFSFLVGTVFGTYPALRAARMDPIEALRS